MRFIGSRLAIKALLLLLLAGILAGCNTTYIPVCWGLGNKPKELSRTDTTLMTLFEHFDKDRFTLRLGGSSFEEVMMPSEVKYHLGAYRPDTKQIYRNLYREYNDRELRDLLVHELAHHIWFNYMSVAQRDEWKEYLTKNPNSAQTMVRMAYPDPRTWDTEDFAFAMQYARREDIKELNAIKLISDEECAAILKSLPADAPVPAKAEATSPPKNPPAAAGTQPKRAASAITMDNR
ncbi:hypothetical protein L4X63_05285 [Geomonas sp. Red32]|uniref:hypothetical protein n=1 Tax=Geomonas sp. Red32 TaxID=2912856 RepID=UPI00202CEAEF|nr:hypothetical protein [Geomonas sp. Red32]MCM0080996.1 hypothetical protein [Geomonas sp. Red32]